MPTPLEIAYLDACAILDEINEPESGAYFVERLSERGWAVVNLPVKVVGTITGASCQRTAMNWGLTLEAAQAARAEFIATGTTIFTGINGAGVLYRIVLTSGRETPT